MARNYTESERNELFEQYRNYASIQSRLQDRKEDWNESNGVQ